MTENPLPCDLSSYAWVSSRKIPFMSCIPGNPTFYESPLPWRSSWSLPLNPLVRIERTEGWHMLTLPPSSHLCKAFFDANQGENLSRFSLCASLESAGDPHSYLFPSILLSPMQPTTFSDCPINHANESEYPQFLKHDPEWDLCRY